MNVVLVSLYDLGHQPFSLGSAAAWLRNAGHRVSMADLSLDQLPALEVREADVIAISLPMHTATRLAPKAIEQVRLLNANARICAFGLYAPLNAEFLRSLGVSAVFGGEWEASLAKYLDGGPAEPGISLERLKFLPPDRLGLPVLSRYAKLRWKGEARVAGYTEASRGCKHLCRHCPVVNVYQGKFRVIQVETVLEDIRRQVAAGARHITFGDPDFWNGPAHARRVIASMHAEFPDVTWDATIKIEHLLRHQDQLELLRDTNCLFVTSAVESVDDGILARLEKGHSRSDFVRIAGIFRRLGLNLAPTFIPFTPWTTREGYADLLSLLAKLELIENAASVQLALRLLVPAGSRLLELPEFARTDWDPQALLHRWTHRDPSMDILAADAIALVSAQQRTAASRSDIFEDLWELAHGVRFPRNHDIPVRATIPYLDEPWYC